MTFTGTILVVDDEPHIRKFVTLILKQQGYRSILEAGNGEDALATYEREKPALVLMDVNMPILDGIETLGRLKQLDPEAVVIMLTSLVNRETIERALQLGAVNYIRKDTPKDEIGQALRETIADCFGDQTEPSSP
ncbi:MAG: response regulator transcription factor [Opitutaceae bacterium]|nr:response regulator transcription factor [Opitutaceae bacterium]